MHLSGDESLKVYRNWEERESTDDAFPDTGWKSDGGAAEREVSDPHSYGYNKIKQHVSRTELLKGISRLDLRLLRHNDCPFLLAPALITVFGI